MKKAILILAVIIVAIAGFNYYMHRDFLYIIRPAVEIEKITDKGDMDKDGIPDMDDIVEGARMEVENKTIYKSTYYKGGYPPDNEGVCTDVIWRALKNAGYDLKSNLDRDIAENLKDYPGVGNAPDPNIDFRRVKNQMVFFEKYAQSLTLDVIPYDKENLKQWQAGDIVVLNEHIAVISDKRRKDGVPLVIHNASTVPKEEEKLSYWSETGKIIGHFRFPKK